MKHIGFQSKFLWNFELRTRHVIKDEEIKVRLDASYEFCFYANLERTLECIIDVENIDASSHPNF